LSVVFPVLAELAVFVAFPGRLEAKSSGPQIAADVPSPTASTAPTAMTATRRLRTASNTLVMVPTSIHQSVSFRLLCVNNGSPFSMPFPGSPVTEGSIVLAACHHRSRTPGGVVIFSPQRGRCPNDPIDLRHPLGWSVGQGMNRGLPHAEVRTRARRWRATQGLRASPLSRRCRGRGQAW
jgi:hypothetical protein